MSCIIGINAHHPDAAACAIVSGRLVAAVEEERFVRRKHWAGIPFNAVRYCLEEAGIKFRDVDVLSINTHPSAARFRRFVHVASHPRALALALKRVAIRRRRRGIVQHLERHFGEAFGGRLLYFEHHLAHMASAFFASGWKEAAVLSVDGFGDFASLAYGFGRNGSIRICRKIYFPHSLGLFYQAMTQYLGFPRYGDEYKVMGMAPYGQPTYLGEMEEIIHASSPGLFELDLRYFRHHLQHIDMQWDDGEPRFDRLYSAALESLLGPAFGPVEKDQKRRRDIAASVQCQYESIFFEIIRNLEGEIGKTRLVLAGGCAMNSVANGKIKQRTRYRDVYIQPAAGDAGGALGAAYLAHLQHERGEGCNLSMETAYLGPEYLDDEMEDVVEGYKEDFLRLGIRKIRQRDRHSLCRMIAKAISSGLIVGWFQGRMEWGARALGNRSILADPRRANMRDILNRKIKRRENFRPFAPSILREHVSEWFEIDDDVPYMMKVYPVREERRGLIPAVVHVDGTGRLQTVDRGSNPLYFDLIHEFWKLTSVPILLNTSFNENEPIVCHPREAVDCFLRTNMDVLVLGTIVLLRRNITSSEIHSQPPIACRK